MIGRHPTNPYNIFKINLIKNSNFVFAAENFCSNNSQIIRLFCSNKIIIFAVKIKLYLNITFFINKINCLATLKK